MANTDEWLAKITALYSEGCSDAEVAAEMEIPVSRFYDMMERNQAFRDLIMYGRTLCQAWWERQARRNITNKQFNSSLYNFYMKNKFGWAEKSEQLTTNDAPQDLETLKQEMHKQLAKFAKVYTPELTDAKFLLAVPGVENGN